MHTRNLYRSSQSIEKPNDLSANRRSFILMDIIPGIVCMSRTDLEFGAQRYYSRAAAVAVEVAGGESGLVSIGFVSALAVQERNCAGDSVE